LTQQEKIAVYNTPAWKHQPEWLSWAQSHKNDLSRLCAPHLPSDLSEFDRAAVSRCFALLRQVSERSERALRKRKTRILAMNPAKWLQTQWLHPLLTKPIPLNSFISLGSLARASFKMRTISLCFACRRTTSQLRSPTAFLIIGGGTNPAPGLAQAGAGLAPVAVAETTQLMMETRTI